jgi:hypothetical protein
MRVIIAMLLLLPAFAFSQYRITVIIEKVPAGTPDRLFIAGNFNEWNPADENNVLEKGPDGKHTRVFEDVPAGEYEYKLTAGSMEAIEVAADGKDINNRLLSLKSDTTIRLTVARWKNGKEAFTENNAAWSNLLQPYYSSAMPARKPDGAISRSRQTLLKN